MDCRSLIGKLEAQRSLTRAEWSFLWSSYAAADRIYAAERAHRISCNIFGKKIYIRGIVEFSNCCKNDCFYCGIRKSNRLVARYNLSDEVIVECCRSGWENNIRTFVLQSGEVGSKAVEHICQLVQKLKKTFPGCAVTLSIGELSSSEYSALRQAGADRYLLRHESADEKHYSKLHPAYMKLKNRLECLENLHRIGFQTGCGVMLGSPFQNADTLAEDMVFMQNFKPEMIGVGPFIPHKDTPFKDHPAGTLEDTLFMISLCRIMHPEVLLPATTALGTLQQDGRLLGVLAGANVIMPNLTPQSVQENYNLYNNKLHTDSAVSVAIAQLQSSLASIGYSIAVGRGDFGE
ncbi:MAG: [FeFe] hydrogenase H-cluster radical SAM maturase HydE [Lentisphaerae bacterium]|nr:[FeFe] hydrogenase H-cluster radical SAM maturase HydE [Lentisphaerota bacterium]